jgi:hypothetical protein
MTVDYYEYSRLFKYLWLQSEISFLIRKKLKHITSTEHCKTIVGFKQSYNVENTISPEAPN